MSLSGVLPPVRSFTRMKAPGSSRCSRFVITPAGCLSGSLSWPTGPRLRPYAGRSSLSPSIPTSGQRSPGEFYDRQLIGLRARTRDGADIGMVGSVLHLPAQDVLQIETAAGTRLVPFVEALVPQVDLDAGYLTVADVAGLLDDEADRGDDEG